MDSDGAELEETVARIPFGEETEERLGEEGPMIYRPYDDVSCPDCNAGRGETHQLGCDIEQCPVCGAQFIGCQCEFEVIASD
jgi:hypothetical protein